MRGMSELSEPNKEAEFHVQIVIGSMPAQGALRRRFAGREETDDVRNGCRNGGLGHDAAQDVREQREIALEVASVIREPRHQELALSLKRAERARRRSSPTANAPPSAMPPESL